MNRFVPGRLLLTAARTESADVRVGGRAAMADPGQRFAPEAAVRRLLRVSEVAAMIGCSPKAVRHRIERGQIPGVVRIGASVYIRRDEVVRFLAEGRGPSPTRSR